jgi:hypothetical protein
MHWGPAGYERRESGAIPAASGRLAFAAVFGVVEKRLAETHMPPHQVVAQEAWSGRLKPAPTTNAD